MSPIPFIYTVRAFMDCHASSETQTHAARSDGASPANGIDDVEIEFDVKGMTVLPDQCLSRSTSPYLPKRYVYAVVAFISCFGREWAI